MKANNGSIQYQRFQIQVSDKVLNKAKSGDRQAHAVLYQTYSNAVYTLALGICGNQQCAEDVLHNTYIKLINKLPSFEGRAPLGMWLRQIAVNESLMYLRKHKKHKAVVSSDQYDFIEDYQTHNEIARFFDKTPSYSKSLVSRALQFLRERLSLQDDLSYSTGKQ